MDSLYISWQLSRSRKKRKNKNPDKESVQGEEERVLSGGGQNGKHFLFTLFLFLFSPALFPLTLGLNPELLKKPLRFSRPLPGVICNNAVSVTVESLCIHRLSPLLQAQDLLPPCFLESYSITNQHSNREEEGGGRYEFNYNIKLCSILLPLQTHQSN